MRTTTLNVAWIDMSGFGLGLLRKCLLLIDGMDIVSEHCNCTFDGFQAALTYSRYAGRGFGDLDGKLYALLRTNAWNVKLTSTDQFATLLSDLSSIKRSNTVGDHCVRSQE